MADQFDLTEDGQFTKKWSLSQSHKEAQPLICWLGRSLDIDQLRKLAKRNHELEQQLVPKSYFTDEKFEKAFDCSGINNTYLHVNRDTEVEIRHHIWTNVSNTTSTTSTITYTFGNTTMYIDGIYNSSGTSYTTSYKPNTTFRKYVYTTDTCGEYTEQEDSTDEKMKELREYLWGCPNRPTMELPIGTTRMKNEFSIDLYGNPTFPWDNREDKILRYHEPINKSKMFPWQPTYVDDQMFEMSDNDFWDMEESAITDDNYVIPIEPTIETNSKFTNRIADIIPWMVDMIRDTWRQTISQDLIDEYFTDQWYNMTDPKYRDRWFSGKQKEEKVTPLPDWIITSSVQRNIYLTSNTVSEGQITWTYV